MKHSGGIAPSIVSQEHDDTLAVGSGTGHKSGPTLISGNVSAQKSGPLGVHDPDRVHREFPARWSSYIRTNFRDLRHIQQVFGVSERAARKWWNGDGGANGAYVAIAVEAHPIAAPRMLFAAE